MLVFQKMLRTHEMNHALWYVHSEAKRKIYVVKQRKHIRISTCFQRYVSHYFKQVWFVQIIPSPLMTVYYSKSNSFIYFAQVVELNEPKVSRIKNVKKFSHSAFRTWRHWIPVFQALSWYDINNFTDLQWEIFSWSIDIFYLRMLTEKSCNLLE